MKVISTSIIKNFNNTDHLITVTYETRRYLFFGPRQQSTHEYIGSGTVWHHHDSFDRCSTNTEMFLSSLCERALLYENSKRP
jgi:hypothetical protein